MKEKLEEGINYSKKELEDRLEKAEPLLADEDATLIKGLISLSKQPSVKPLANKIGMFLDITITCAGEIEPIKRYNGKPAIATDSHSLILGYTGTGKTVYSNIQVFEIIKDNPGITIMVIDCEGDRAPFIITRLEELGMGDRWICLDENTLRENFFEMALISPTWFTDVTDVILEVGYYGDLGGKIRQFAMDCNARGEFHRRGGFATWKEFVGNIKALKLPKGSKESQYRDTIAIRLENWIPAIGDIFNCRSGIPWSEFDGKCVIIDISQMHEDAQIFLQIYLLRKLLFLKERTSQLKCNVIYDLDELSKFIVNNHVRTQGQGPLTVVDVARRARKRGVFLAYKDQVAHLVPPVISANCPTTVIFRLLQKDDLKKVQNEMNLTSDQGVLTSQLEPRQCIYRSQDMKEAMLAEVEEVDLSNLLTHEEIRALMKEKQKDLPWEPADTRKTEYTERRKKTLSENASTVLKIIQLYPAMPLHKIKKMSGFKTGQFNKIVEHLALLLMITEPEALSLGFPGKPSFYTELLPAGNEELGLDPNEPHLVCGKNKSLLARIMLTILAKHHKVKGIEYKTEYRSCDLVAFHPDKKISCFEVETFPDTPQIAKNIRRNINELDPIEIVVIFETVEQISRAKEVAESRLSQTEMKRVRFEQIKNFMSALD